MMHLESGLCPGEDIDVHDLPPYYFPISIYWLLIAITMLLMVTFKLNDKLNYEEVFGNDLKTLDDVLDEMKDLFTTILESDGKYLVCFDCS